MLRETLKNQAFFGILRRNIMFDRREAAGNPYLKILNCRARHRAEYRRRDLHFRATTFHCAMLERVEHVKIIDFRRRAYWSRSADNAMSAEAQGRWPALENCTNP
jgi:hypothetical protein